MRAPLSAMMALAIVSTTACSHRTEAANEAASAASAPSAATSAPSGPAAAQAFPTTFDVTWQPQTVQMHGNYRDRLTNTSHADTVTLEPYGVRVLTPA